MNLKWKIGDVTITKVVESETLGGGEWILPDAKPEAVKDIGWLEPHFMNAEGKLIMSWRVLEDGRVSDATIETDAFQSSDVGACVLKVVEGMRFPTFSAYDSGWSGRTFRSCLRWAAMG